MYRSFLFRSDMKVISRELISYYLFYFPCEILTFEQEVLTESTESSNSQVILWLNEK